MRSRHPALLAQLARIPAMDPMNAWSARWDESTSIKRAAHHVMNVKLDSPPVQQHIRVIGASLETIGLRQVVARHVPWALLIMMVIPSRHAHCVLVDAAVVM